jgi:hypothetical protein
MAKAYFIPNGPKNLETLFPLVDFNNVGRYYVEVKDANGDVIATSPMNIQCCGCCEDDRIRINFLNYLGGVDAIDFKLLSQEHESNSSDFEKPVQYPLEKPVHGLGRFNVKSNDTFLVSNNEYTEADKDWVDELLDSPIAWLQWEGTQGQEDSYIPIVILDKKTEKVKKEDRFIYEITLEFKFSHEKFIIRN